MSRTSLPAAQTMPFFIALMFSGAGNAQETSDRDTSSADGLEEVIVTARGREENLQEVPLSITVFSDEAILDRGIVDARDVAAFTPSLTFYSGSGRADLSALTVRGLSPQTSDERYQGLSIFIDGIYISGQLAGIDLSQLERVEVLKGPQSAKYGRATYSGAIDYITRTPMSNEIEGNLRARYSEHGSDSASSTYYAGRLSVPLKADAVWLSLNAASNRTGGRYPLLGNSGGQRAGEEETDSVGATLFTRFSDDASLKLRYAFDEERDAPSLSTVIQPTDWGGLSYDIPGLYTITSVSPNTPACPGPAGGFACYVGTVWVNGDIPNSGAGLTGSDAVSVFPVGSLPAEYPDYGGRSRKRQFASALYEHDFGGYAFSYRGGYFEQEYWAVEDFRLRAQFNDPTFGPLGVTGGAKTFFVIAFEESFRNHSHQLRLASPVDERLRWSAGLYYFDEETENFGATLPTGAATAVLRQSRGLETFENTAVFGDIAYDVTDRLTLTLEGRYQEETVGYDACTTCSTANPVDREEKDTSFLPRLTAQFAFTEDLNAYAYYSSGEKSGRFNTSAGAFNFAYIPPEELDNFEVGLKSALWDRRVILNVAAFYQDITGQQLLVQVPNPQCVVNPATGVITCPPGQITTLFGVQPVGDSEIYGFEIEGRAQLSDRFSVSYGFGYAHHEFLDAVGPFRNTDAQFFLPGETLQGKTSINTPRETGNLSAEYRLPLGGGRFDLSLRADALYTGKRYVDLANRASIEAVTRFNARISLSGDDNRWQLSLFGKDLTDEDTLLGAGLTATSSCYFPETPVPATSRAQQRCQLVGLPRGREIGLELSYGF